MFELINVVVLGVGLMGCGIVQVFVSYKVLVFLFDFFEQVRDIVLFKIINGIKSMGGDIFVI